MDAIVSALISAGIPLLSQVLQLGSLFIEAKVKGLSLAEVEEEIARITGRSSNLDETENKAAGLPSG